MHIDRYTYLHLRFFRGHSKHMNDTIAQTYIALMLEETLKRVCVNFPVGYCRRQSALDLVFLSLKTAAASWLLYMALTALHPDYFLLWYQPTRNSNFDVSYGFTNRVWPRNMLKTVSDITMVYCVTLTASEHI